jgi:UDP-glucose 4-epimerase
MPMRKQILITGSCGLVGSATARTLESAGFAVRGFDVAAPRPEDRGDVCDAKAVREAVAPCAGVLHLGAISRVLWGERSPERCWATNVEGTRNVLQAVASTGGPAFAVVASSREVYGQADALPVAEDAARRPINAYGRSTVAAEDLTEAARRHGVRAAVVRLSNVYGSACDHRDRVVPAFARAATRDAPLRVDGAAHTFDFTHIDDVARGLTALVLRLDAGAEPPPPIHLVSGIGTTLGELAQLVVSLAGAASAITQAPPRDYDVARFRGDPARAAALLEWRPRVPLRDGLARLIADLREEDAR